MSKGLILNIQGVDINVTSKDEEDYICLSDMVAKNGGNSRIQNWIRNKGTLEFLGVWEQMNNPNFNTEEYNKIMMEAGLDRFIISPAQWIKKTNAIGITSKAGKYGGTYAHKDIAFEFGSHLSPVFKLLLIKEFQRLKDEEAKRLNNEWDYRRFLSKANYTIHTDAIKAHLIPISTIPKAKQGIVYANEAEVLNYALFNMSSKDWKEQNPTLALNGKNMRDYADAHQLIVLSNLEGINAELIKQKVDVKERVKYLRNIAIDQLNSLRNSRYTLEMIKSPYLKANEKSTTSQSKELPNSPNDKE